MNDAHPLTVINFILTICIIVVLIVVTLKLIFTIEHVDRMEGYINAILTGTNT